LSFVITVIVVALVIAPIALDVDVDVNDNRSACCTQITSEAREMQEIFVVINPK